MTQKTTTGRGGSVYSCGMSGVMHEFSRKTTPKLDYIADELFDRRALRPGEKERVLALIRGTDAETRCAAAYICIRLGIAEAQAAMKAAAAEGIESPHVKCSFEFASMCLGIMQKNGTVPPESEQLLILLRLRNSDEPTERRFAHLVLEKADIKYGTYVSW